MKMVKNKDHKAVVRSSFMDFERLVLSSETEQRHVPYAVGVMKVDPGKGLRGEIAGLVRIRRSLLLKTEVRKWLLSLYLT